MDPRWGKVGKQTITDEGPLPPHPIDGIKYNMETLRRGDRKRSLDFIERSHKDGKPFFVVDEPFPDAHLHPLSSEKYLGKIRRRTTGPSPRRGWSRWTTWSGPSSQKLNELGISDNTIIVLTTDNGAETFSWPDGGITPFPGRRG